MARPSTKKFDFGEGIYYFNIRKGYNSVITIKRMKKQKALQDFSNYKKSYKDVEWLGKWDGKKFVESNYEALAS
jgi:hypothetical protein